MGVDLWGAGWVRRGVWDASEGDGGECGDGVRGGRGERWRRRAEARGRRVTR